MLNTVTCDPAVRTGLLPRELTEASGVAISRRNPGILWVHNDDPPVVLYGIDSTGAIRGRVRVLSTAAQDIEDIAIAPCREGSCLFIGDIGDNSQTRRTRAVYRIPEPLITDSVSAEPTVYPFHLPGKAQDAEALFVMPDSRMYIVTKGRSGPITVFEYPLPARAGEDVELKPAFELSRRLVQLPDMITGAGVTPDGRFVAIRSYSELQLYTLRRDTLKSVLPRPVDLANIAEPQGEGADIDNSGVIYLVSEKGLADSAPPISRVQCHLPH